MAAVLPPVHELEFLKTVANHNDLRRKLALLGIPAAQLASYAEHICKCWFKLAEEHLSEATQAASLGFSRSAYSRAYYAAYNASKAARYYTSGFVSLKGDDHAKAGPELPGDLPDVDKWSRNIGILIEHRHRADYDNWHDVASKNSITPAAAAAMAGQFIDIVRTYLKDKHGVVL